MRLTQRPSQTKQERKIIMKKLFILLTLLSLLLVPAATMASTLYGGDASDQASADDILDIIFLIDVSGSMYDDINAIGAVAQSTIANLECPDCNVWVRATFAGIRSAAPSYYDPNHVFNEGFTGSHISSVEDNGGAALDAINSASGTWWVDDSTAEQDYYRAVVTIGDEGTENGYPVYQNDWDIAYAANQAAIATPDLFLFSWVTNDPYTNVPELFSAMAVGGTGGGYVFGDTGGSFVDDRLGSNDVTQTLEDIICTAASGGTGGDPVPEPATMLLLGTGIVGLAGASRKKLLKK
jgi:hypothetical protein